MRLDARSEHNRECLELWLLTRAERISTRAQDHRDAYHDKSAKQESRPTQDTTWLEAISSPDCRRTDAYLRRVMKDMQDWEPEAHDVLTTVYTGNSSDPSLPEQWRSEVAEAQGSEKRWVPQMLLHYLEDAFVFVLYRLHRDRRLLYWPSPDEAHGYAQGQEKKRRVARYTYESALDEGVEKADAFKKAVAASKASRTSVFYWTRNVNGREARRRGVKQDAGS